MPESFTFHQFKTAYDLCEEADFVKEFFDKDDKRNKLLPDLQIKEPVRLTFDTFFRQMWGTLLSLQYAGDLSSDLVEKIKKLISKYFSAKDAFKNDELSAFSIICLASIHWLEQRKRSDFLIVLLPKS